MLSEMELSSTELKKTIRRETLEKRDAIPVPVKRAKDSAIKERLTALEEFKGAGRILLYASFRSEVETGGILTEALSAGKRVMFPRVEGEALRIYEVRGPEELTPGHWGIPEPHASEERLREVGDVDVVIVPGVAFDRGGWRLGYGKGYYDRLLSGARGKTFIALSYEEQMTEGLPHDEHDVGMDIIVTDKDVIHCHGQGKD